MSSGSPSILRIAIVGGFISGLLLASMGMYLVYRGSAGDVELTLFDQSLSSNNVGLAAIFIGAVLIVIVVRKSLAVLVLSTSRLDDATTKKRSPEKDTKFLDDHTPPIDQDAKNSKCNTFQKNQDLTSLRDCLDDLSNKQKHLLRAVADGSGMNYVSDLLEDTELGLSRREIVYMARDLSREGLLETIYQTDYRYKLSREVLAAVNHDLTLFRSLLSSN